MLLLQDLSVVNKGNAQRREMELGNEQNRGSYCALGPTPLAPYLRLRKLFIYFILCCQSSNAINNHKEEYYSC